MLSNDVFYFGTLRKYIALFGSLFNDMIINRTDKSGNITQIVNVPIQYGQKEKMMTRMKEDPAINREAAIVLPRMSFFMDGITYDSSRKRATTNKLVYASGTDNVKVQYEEVPYDIHFSLYIYVKNAEDGTKIVEQILPFFTPEFTVRAFMIPNHPSFDVPVVLRQITHGDPDTQKFEDNSVLIWTLNFTIKGSFFGPIKSQPLILNVNNNIYIGTWANTSSNVHAYGMSNVLINTIAANNEYTGYISFTPGLDANGNPTDNAAISIPANQISSSSDWDMIITIGDVS